MNDAFARGQLSSGKETGAAVSHAQQGFPIDRAIKTKTEEPGGALTEKTIDVDFGVDD